MVNKYARLLEEQDINTRTGEIWTINDVPSTWRKKVQAKVESDGYLFDEDGIAYPALKEEPAEEVEQ